MKKILVISAFILAAVIMFFSSKGKNDSPPKKILLSPAPTQKLKIAAREKRSIFIPDWSLPKETVLGGNYERYIYFGNENRIPGFTTWFTVKVNEIPTQSLWESEVKKEIDIAKSYNMEGIVLDLEINGLPTEETVTQINKSVEYFYSQTKQYYIKLAVAVYGDVFYRRRPYDLRFINQNSDEVMVMAYDFHKSRGEPGPNFPFQKDDKYDYDFQMMIDDFTQFVPPEKLTIIFGLFGYDWSVDEKKRPLSPAKALTLNEIKKKFLKKCEWKDCIIKKDDVSRETEIDYINSTIVNDFANMEYHIVWFEDEESVKVKVQYLKEKGIGSVAYWAYGYF